MSQSAHAGDVRNIPTGLRCDVVVAGPPCQATELFHKALEFAIVNGFDKITKGILKKIHFDSLTQKLSERPGDDPINNP